MDLVELAALYIRDGKFPAKTSAVAQRIVLAFIGEMYEGNPKHWADYNDRLRGKAIQPSVEISSTEVELTWSHAINPSEAPEAAPESTNGHRLNGKIQGSGGG